MLISEGLAVGGVKGDVLRSPIKGGAEVEQLAVGAPAGALLRFGAQVAQERNRLFPEGLGVFGGVHQHIHQAVQTLVAEDGEGLAELLQGADSAAEEMAVSQLHHPAVDVTVVELLAVFLAAAKGADEFAHRDLALHHLAGFHAARGLGVALGDVAFEHLAVGTADDFRLFSSGEARTHLEQLAPFGGQGIDRRQLQALLHAAALALLGAGGGNGQLLQQDVEAIDRQLAGFRPISKQLG